MIGEFDPMYSTNNIFVDENMDQCLTIKIETIESNVSGKAPTNHTHSYNDLTNKPTTIANADTVDGKHASEFAASTHTHSFKDLTGTLPAISDADTVDGKHASDFALANHTHSATDWLFTDTVTNLQYRLAVMSGKLTIVPVTNE